MSHSQKWHIVSFTPQQLLTSSSSELSGDLTHAISSGCRGKEAVMLSSRPSSASAMSQEEMLPSQCVTPWGFKEGVL